MAIFRAKEVAQFTNTELTEHERKLQIELIQQYENIKSGGSIKNPGKIREIRRTIARIKTERTKRRSVTSSN